MSIPGLLAGFAVPSIIAMVISSLYNIVDQIFIGQSVGYLGNAATNVAFPLTTVCMAITLTIAVGTAARFSLFLGQKKEHEAAGVVGNGLCMMVLFGALYLAVILLFNKQLLMAFGATDAILDYAIQYTGITAFGMPFLIIMNGMSNIARADGSPLYSMTSMIIGAVINTILDPILIFGFDMGVAGAAIATVAGQVISCIYALLYLKRLRRITLHKEDIRLVPKQMADTAAMGMSNGLTQVSITLVQVVINRSLVHYGALSQYGADIPLAASGIVMKVNAIVLAVIIGMIQGMQPIIGYNYGAKKYDRVKQTYNIAVLCELVITGVAFVVFQLFPAQVLSLFGSGENEELYYEFGILFMRTFLLMLPLAGVQMISSNMFSAIGKPLKGTILSLTRQVFFLIPLMLILPLFMGINGVMTAAPVADSLSFVTVMIFVIFEMRSMTKLKGKIKGNNEQR